MRTITVQHFYREAAVTVLPSVYVDVYGNRHPAPELLGLVLLESMACGTAVICSEAGAMSEFVEQGITGYVVPPNDSQALGMRIAQLVDNPELSEKMGAAGKEKVRAYYTWDKIAPHTLRCYNPV